MPRMTFVPREFSAGSLGVIERANTIIAEYQEQGFTLTLRQLYYQFVARALIPNKQTDYKRLGSIINDARLAGLIDWDAIEDRTRNLETLPAWEDPPDILSAIANQYRRNPWEGQKHRPEVWIEKEALVGVVEPVCEEFQVPYYACRGYSSQSETWRAGMRFRKYLKAGLTPYVLHLGDHDPSGIDMTRDNAERLALFTGGKVRVHRLALNMDQVEEYEPPPNPAKETDSRHSGYVEIYGNESWELDALEPTVIDRLIRTSLEEIINRGPWDEVKEAEAEDRRKLGALTEKWDEIAGAL